jgi:hypothetical protein
MKEKASQIWIIRVLMMLAALFFVWYSVFHTIETGKNQAAGKTDLAVFYAAGQIIAHEPDIPAIDIYKRKKIFPIIQSIRPQKGGTKYLYTPPTALIFVPLTVFSFKTVAYIWGVVNVIMVLASCALVIRYLLYDTIFRYRYLALLIALPFLDAVHSLFRSGQTNGFLLLMIVGAFVALKNRPWFSGILFASAAVVKIFPGVFFLYLLAKRQWKAAIAFMVACFGWLIVSLPFFGISGFVHFMTVVLPKLLGGGLNAGDKSTTLQGAFEGSVKNGDFTWTGIQNSVLLKHSDLIFTCLAIVALIGLLVLIGRYHSRLRGKQLVLDYTLLMTFALLFPSAIHLAYYIWLLPVVLFWLERIDVKRPWREWLLPAAMLATLFFTFVWKVLPFRPHDTFFGWKVMTLAVTIIFITTALFYIRTTRRRLYQR